VGLSIDAFVAIAKPGVAQAIAALAVALSMQQLTRRKAQDRQSIQEKPIMTTLATRAWVPAGCEARVQAIAATTAQSADAAVAARITALVETNRQIHERDCFNLNPATNVMNPRAEAMLASGIGSRPSLGYPGDKYEMGLEAIEEIEVIAAELAAQVFGASYAEIRVPSGALANLFAFMATCRPRRHDHRATRDRGRPCDPSYRGLRGSFRVAHHPRPDLGRGFHGRCRRTRRAGRA